MWIWKKMEKISWTAKVSNSEVLNRVSENCCIISMINQRKRRWLGHVLRHNVILWDVLEGRMTGKCTRGERDYSWWATYARDMKQQRNELKTDVCDVSQWWESLTCYYSRIPEEDTMFVTFFIFFQNRHGGQTRQPIFTLNDLNDVDSCIDVPYALKIETFSNPWPPAPKTAKIWHFWGGTENFRSISSLTLAVS